MKNEFGKFLLDKRKQSGITQKQLANKIGKSTMAISLFESGENQPPSGVLLEQIISSLQCSSHEALLFRFYAAKSRKSIPEDINNFFFENEVIYEIILLAQDNKISGKDLMYFITSYLENHPIKELTNDLQDN